MADAASQPQRCPNEPSAQQPLLRKAAGQACLLPAPDDPRATRKADLPCRRRASSRPRRPSPCPRSPVQLRRAPSEHQELPSAEAWVRATGRAPTSRRCAKAFRGGEAARSCEAEAARPRVAFPKLAQGPMQEGADPAAKAAPEAAPEAASPFHAWATEPATGVLQVRDDSEVAGLLMLQALPKGAAAPPEPCRAASSHEQEEEAAAPLHSVVLQAPATVQTVAASQGAPGACEPSPRIHPGPIRPCSPPWRGPPHVLRPSGPRRR